MSTDLVRQPQASVPVISESLTALGVTIESSGDGLYRGVHFPPELREKANVLLPVTEVAQALPDFTPSIRAVQLDPDPVNGAHFYVQQWEGRGDAKRPKVLALRKQALETLADLAGVMQVRTRPLSGDELEAHHKRDDDGKIVQRALGYEALVTIRRSDGTPKTVTAKKVWDPEVEFRKVEASLPDWASGDKRAPELSKRWLAEREHGPAKAESKAIQRAFRALLQIPHTYTPDRASLPFVVVGYQFTPDTSDPLVRRLLIEHGYGEAAALYPGDDSPAALRLDGEQEAAVGSGTAAASTPNGAGAEERAAKDEAAAPAASFTGEEPAASTPSLPSLEELGAYRLPTDFGQRFPGAELSLIAGEDMAYLNWLASDAVQATEVREAAAAFVAALAARTS